MANARSPIEVALRDSPGIGTIPKPETAFLATLCASSRALDSRVSSGSSVRSREDTPHNSFHKATLVSTLTRKAKSLMTMHSFLL